MRANFSMIVVVMGIFILGVVGSHTDAGAQAPDLQKIKDLIGNENLDPNTLPADVKESLSDISKVVSETPDDCATKEFSVKIPKDWRCRKLNKNAQDVTLYTAKNTLNLTIGTNQGKSSCDVIPGCTKESIDLGTNFADTIKLVLPLLGSVEIVGRHVKNSDIKLLVTSNDAISKDELEQIRTALDSVSQK